ncbi:MAG: hypothetical protein J7513_00255 [Solirubrobacteraceae bacterium]|nr:hypothetical protein [Solirubrobacteraceae bacterium]
MPSSPEPRTVRALLLLAAALLTLGRRAGLNTGVRMHVQRLQRVAPIQQFAPIYANRALLDRDGEGLFSIRIIAQRDVRTGRLVMVPIDERVLAGWLA